MKRLTLPLVVALLTFVSGVTISVLWIVPLVGPVVERETATDAREIQDDEPAAPKDIVTFKDAVAYKGTSFRFNPSLASEVKAETVPAHPDLRNTTDKLEAIPVEHLAFTFVDSPHQSTFWGAAEIDVYRLADYEKAFGGPEIHPNGVNEEIQLLRLILSERPGRQALKKLLAKYPSPDINDFPVLPFLDGGQAFHARVKYVNFKNGKAVAFLTQYNIDTSLINNQGLAYVFQGITNDGIHGVTAIFPVSAPFLPKDFDAQSTKEFKPSKNFYLLLNDSKEYQTYLRAVVPRLEALPPGKYSPSLTLFEELIATLDVQGQN